MATGQGTVDDGTETTPHDGAFPAGSRWLPPIRIAGGAPFEGDASQGYGIDRIRVDGARDGVAAEIRTLALRHILVKRVAGVSPFLEFEIAGRVRVWRLDSGCGEANDGRHVFPLREGSGAVALRGTTRAVTDRGGFGWMVDIEEEALFAAAERSTGRVLPRTLPLARPLDAVGSQRFAVAVRAFEGVFSAAVPAETRHAALHETEGRLLDAVIAGPLGAALEPFAPSGSGSAPVATVRRAVDVIMAQSREPLTLAEVAAAAGVGARALQIAFRRQLGCSPLAYLRLVRLADARRLLVLGLVARVTDAAMQAGFWHLGEFAVAYRQRYGERPSAALKACPDSLCR